MGTDEATLDAATPQQIVEHSTLDHMNARADEVTPPGGALWDGGGDSFFRKGTNGRWRDMRAAEDVAAHETRALAQLGPDCADWLANGSMATPRAAA